MNKKTVRYVYICVAVVVVIAAGAAYVHYRSVSMQLAVQNGELPKNHTLSGVLVSSTPSSVTMTLADGTQQTFSVATTTQIITLVAAGEVGKPLSDIAAGSQVLILPHAANSSVADSVTALPAPAVVNQDPAGPTVEVMGALLATTTASITVKTDTVPSMHITLTKDTRILSYVLTGQKGKTLSDKDVYIGNYVQVMGVASTKGLVADTVQLILPLAQ
jgi:hypothetical protein